LDFKKYKRKYAKRCIHQAYDNQKNKKIYVKEILKIKKIFLKGIPEQNTQ
jgi:hypothetical protein